MSTTSSKFSIENFEPTPDDELICSICRCIFDEPMECPCRHIFCRACITNWLEFKRSCPICRKYVSSFDLKSVAPLIKNMISKLTMVCPNRDNGCKSKITLDSYNSHVSCCLYEIIGCKNNSCAGMFLRKDIEDHEKVNCEFRLIMCGSECNLMLPISKVKKHNCVKELKQRLEESTKREETLNKNILELTNELNTLKKKNSPEENRFFHPYFSLFSSDDASNSYADSFSTETNGYLSDSTQSLFQNLRSRLSNLTMSLTDLEDSLVSSNTRSRSNSNTVSEDRRPSDMSLEIISDVDNNSTLSTVSLDSPSPSLSPSEPSSFLRSSSNSESSETSSSSRSVLELIGSDDDDFPTLAQRRILKRKHSSAVSVSSESDETELEVRTRRRRPTEQQNNSRNSANASKNNTRSGSKSKTKKNNGQTTSSPRSVVPVEVPDPVVPRNSIPPASSQRSARLAEARRLIELCPDWETPQVQPRHEEIPGSFGVPVANIINDILNYDSDAVYESPDLGNISEVESDDDNYEVLVPERTYDLLVRYSREDSEDDDEWLPRNLSAVRHRETSEESDGELQP